MIVKFADLRAAGICRRCRFWFDENGLDFREFVRNGLPAEALLAPGTKTEDVKRAIEAARLRSGQKE